MKYYKLLYTTLFFLLVNTIINAQDGTPVSIKERDTVAVDDRGYIVNIGDKCPDFELQLIDGSKISSNQFEGKVVMLQFTASWCGVCRKEMPHIENKIWLPNKDKDFILIGVDRDEPLEKVIPFIKQMKVTYPVALDPNADVFAKFASRKSGVTRNVIIDKDGNIVFLTRLYDPKEFEAMRIFIENLLN